MTEPRVALVTGGARGIGAAVARRLHAQGRRVVLADLLTTEAEALADELDGRAYRCDVTDSDGVRDMVSAIETDLGPVDVLVNCAGFDRFVRFVDTDEDFWDTIIDINYKGTLRTCHAVLPGMTERGWGRIVNFASDAARVGSSLESVYAGAKAGVIGFTKTLAMELGEFGVRANAICPGSVDNERMAHVVALEASASGRPSAAIREGFARQVSLQTFVDVEDIAAMVRFVCSPAGARISGQALTVDGHTESTRTY